ncbi:MAG TPA: hypothetical protein PL153_11120 [Tenuifilum sp.]|nr:hypothetical protein [Tenuifilum sp.]
MRLFDTKVIKGALLLAVFAMLFSSCLKDDDLMTADAKTGGLVESAPLVQLVPKKSHNVDIELKVYMGPAIQEVKVFKQFFHNATNEASNVELLGSFSVSGQNLNDTLFLNQTFTWEQLKQGLTLDSYTLPDDPLNADIGDYFMLKYVSVMDDGREVTSNSQTEVLVANSFSGYYLSDITYIHPNLGTRQYQLIKELITESGNTCSTNFAVWGSYGETIYLTINPDNSITFNVLGFDYIVEEGDPNNPLVYSHYDPVTDFIYLYYHYLAPGGYRVFYEVLEPITKK